MNAELIPDDKKITFDFFCKLYGIKQFKTPLPKTLSGMIYFDGTEYYIISNRKGINKKLFEIEAMTEYLDMASNEKPKTTNIRLIESKRQYD